MVTHSAPIECGLTHFQWELIIMGLIKTARLMSQIWDSVKFMQIGRDQIKKQPTLDRNLTTDRRPLQINDGQETSISDFQHFRIFWCMIRCWFSLHAQIREQRLDCYRLLEEVYQKMLKHESLFLQSIWCSSLFLAVQTHSANSQSSLLTRWYLTLLWIVVFVFFPSSSPNWFPRFV